MKTKPSFSCPASLVLMISMLHFLGCATAPPPAPEPEPVDPYADFRGTWFEADKPFRLESIPMANRDLDVRVTLKKVEWTTEETRDGSEIRDASAVVVISRGEESRRLRMDEGETKSAFDITVTVTKAGEDYSDSRMQYLPWVDIHIR